jgi:hypothetical protein
LGNEQVTFKGRALLIFRSNFFLANLTEKSYVVSVMTETPKINE